MRITSLSLANFRVFPEVELELPAGVVGIYGPNGSGKSTLIEAVLWALFGVARTPKEGVRRDGSTDECRATVGFEHEGHAYEVTRAVSGAAHTVRSEVRVDGERLAAGATAVRQYVHHVLGLSVDAFRASVFCEQKQLDAFSSRRPEDRRRLVLDLLGITPLDRARDSARGKARNLVDQVGAARLVLGDLDALAAELAALEARRAEAATARAAAQAALTAAESADQAAEAEAARQDQRKAERDRLAAAYQEAKRRAEEGQRRLATLVEEQAQLAEAERSLPALEEAAGQLEAGRRGLAAVEAVLVAAGRAQRAAAALPSAAPKTDLATLEAAAASAARAAGEAAGQVAALSGAAAAAASARHEADREARAAGQLDRSAPCPLCGQELGSCYEEVAAQRQAAVDRAAAAERAAADQLAAAQAAAAAAEEDARQADAARQSAQAEATRRAAVQTEHDEAERALAAARGSLAEALPAELSGLDLDDQAKRLQAGVAAAEAGRDAALRLCERLSRAATIAAAVTAEQAAVDEAETLTARFLEEGKALGFDSGAHATAHERRLAARAALGSAREAAVEAKLNERGLAERLLERQAHVEAEVARRAELADEDDARHHARLAELLAEFRNSLVGEVGPALSAQTTALFRSLTDGRFERLEVDPETFELRVWTGGADHSLERHSGSESDLANLSLRVAIAEQVSLLSGGQVGLLVLDEVLGSLDGEHRDRLLAAITQLGGRFRQVVVVTHDPSVKEQLPYAVEVVPVTQGHSRARLAPLGLGSEALATPVA